MNNKSAPPAKPYVYAFTSGQLVILLCLVLVLMVLSLMLGIRIEGYQRTGRDVPHETARQLPAPQALPAQSADLQETPATAEEAPVEEPAAAEKSAAETAVSTPPAPAKTEQPVQTPKPEPKPAVTAPKPEPKPAVTSPKPEPAKTQPAEAKPVTVTKEAPNKRYVVQVSSSQDKSMAASQTDILKQKGFAAFVEEADLGAKGRFYRVMIGPFPTEAEAQRIRSQVVKDPMFAASYVRQLP
jgi:cell division septation protein DedD